MFNRRQVILMYSSLPLTGACGQWIKAVDADSAFPVIDAHAHFFNARDVPAAGFLTQVVLRDPEHPVTEPGIIGAVTRLLITILRQVTLDARSERVALEGPAPVLATPASDDAQRAAVGRAIEMFTRNTMARGLSVTSGDAAADAALGLDEDVQLLRRLTTETGVDFLATASTGRSVGEAQSDAFYEKGRDGSYLLRSRLAQTIRWAGLFTCPRQQILGTYRSLYANKRQVRIVAPALVDFALWFPTERPISPLIDQIEVMATLAQQSTDLLVLNIAPFCPLRAVIARRAGRDPLLIFKRAIEHYGFVGVKLYPPLGFLPADNPPDAIFGAQSGKRATGRELNRELNELFAWCASNQVSVMAHAANGNAAGVCTGLNASPRNWKPVVETHRSLRVNLAHFGGFSESGPALPCAQGGLDWELLGAEIATQHNGVYFDLGYWTEAFVEDPANSARVARSMRLLIDAYPGMRHRLLFGTDWIMLGREPRHPDYLPKVADFLRECGLAPQDVFLNNARAFFGLRPGAIPWKRLAAFFGEGRLLAALSASGVSP